MKTHTSGFKDAIKNFGRELDSKITYMAGSEFIELGASQLNSVTPHYEGTILKSVMKQLDVDSNEYIPEGTEINYQFGIKVDVYEQTEDTKYKENVEYYTLNNNDYILLIKGIDYNVNDNIVGIVYNSHKEYEYLDFGNYIVYKTEKQEDTDSWKITCYDKMLYAMKDYEDMEITYPITIRNYVSTICTQIGLTFENASDQFANYDKEITQELYLDSNGGSLGYTFRDVLDELAQVTASTICINSDDELEIRYINDTNDTIDEMFLKDVNVNFESKFGPVNSIVLTRAGGSDSVYLQDGASIYENGLCEIKIEDNQIMNGNDRADYLQDILEQLDGLEYYINDFASTGIAYLELCDNYNIEIGENTYNCIMLNDELLVTQGLEENIHTDMPDETETPYKHASDDDRKINQTYIIVKKNEGQIESLTSRTDILENQTKDTYTVEQINQLIQNAVTGLTNTFTQSGGNNVLRNTGLWFETTDSNNPYEFWTGLLNRKKEEKAINMIGILLQNNTAEQKQEVANGTYTISFKYKKLIEASVVKVYINDIPYNLTELTDTEFVQTFEITSQSIDLSFESNVDNACEIYDLMLNVGDVALIYTQNQNETTTDTVNISKGITITSSDVDVTFKANADGIRTLDKTGNILTEFTDTGMTTKEATIENKAQIVGTIWQEVDGQTWITRI